MKKANRIIEIIFYVMAACALVYAFMATSSAVTQYQQAALYMADQLDFGTVLGFFLGQLVPSYFYPLVLFALGWIIGGNVSSHEEKSLPKIPDQRELKKEEKKEAKEASEVSVEEAILEEEAPMSVSEEDAEEK